MKHSNNGIVWFDCTGMGDCTFVFHKPDTKTTELTLGERAALWLESVANLVREKNKAYGDSLGSPMRVFSKADPLQLILARIDDKLSRIARGNAAGEDVAKDLVGYIALAICQGWVP